MSDDSFFDNNYNELSDDNSYVSNKNTTNNNIEQTNDNNSMQIKNYSDYNDYYNINNKQFMDASSYPNIPCPTTEDLKIEFNYKSTKGNNNNISNNNNNKDSNMIGRFIYMDTKQDLEKFTIKLDETKEELNIDNLKAFNLEDKIINYHKDSDNLNHIKDINFSKDALRNKLTKVLYDISQNYKDYILIKEAKKKINPYDLIFEDFFHRNSSVQLANIDSLFNFELLNQDFINETTDILIIGDDGGYTDYLTWRKRDYPVNIYNLCPNNSKYTTTKFRDLNSDLCQVNTISIDNSIFKLNDSSDNTTNNKSTVTSIKENNYLDDYNFNSENLENLINLINSKTDGLSLIVVKKPVSAKIDLSFKEANLKKYFLLNIIISLKLLSSEGNLIIKLEETYSNFVINLLYLLYNTFESITIIKPLSSNKTTASRFIICFKLNKIKADDISNYLQENILDFYNELTLMPIRKDLESIYDINIVSHDEYFKNKLYSIINDIDEKRINTLEELIIAVKNNGNDYKIIYDKMGIKKKCLESWKLPVTKYIASEEYSNKIKTKFDEYNNKRLKNIEQNKPLNMMEKARLYKDYDKYESNTVKQFFDMLGNNKCNKKYNNDNENNESSKYKTHRQRINETGLIHNRYNNKNELIDTEKDDIDILTSNYNKKSSSIRDKNYNVINGNNYKDASITRFSDNKESNLFLKTDRNNKNNSKNSDSNNTNSNKYILNKKRENINNKNSSNNNSYSINKNNINEEEVKIKTNNPLAYKTNKVKESLIKRKELEENKIIVSEDVLAELAKFKKNN